jgi:hypothetical protein
MGGPVGISGGVEIETAVSMFVWSIRSKEKRGLPSQRREWRDGMSDKQPPVLKMSLNLLRSLG